MKIKTKNRKKWRSVYRKSGTTQKFNIEDTKERAETSYSHRHSVRNIRAVPQ